MNIGEIVDGRFEVISLCSSSGGMGNVVLVKDKRVYAGDQLALKYCKATDPRLVKRFKREVMLLSQFGGNGRVAQIISYNNDHDPPYYVMPYYKAGDLMSARSKILGDEVIQEKIFCEMIDCIEELHSKNIFHRDIKPQNFLFDESRVVVSDLGLSVETESTATTFTTTAEAWGTVGFAPPEFFSGGFKNPDVAGDVFMLGKTFYNLITGRNPIYMTPDNVHPGLFHVIQRACSNEKIHRYQSMAELKQSLVSVYDIILGRVDGVNSCRNKLSSIVDKLSSRQQYDVAEISEFLDCIAALEVDEQDAVCQSLPVNIFSVFSQEPFSGKLASFLVVYRQMVERGNYGWSFAETVADSMYRIFVESNVGMTERAEALSIAIHAAVAEHRFAAMTTCKLMIASIGDNDLAIHVAPVLERFKGTFVKDIEPVSVKNDVIAQLIRKMNTI